MQETLPRTINDIVAYRAQKTPGRPGFWIKDDRGWHPLRWSEYFNLIESLARGLCALGIKKGDRVFIMSRTRYEWDVAEKALFLAGAVVGGIDVGLSGQDIAYIVRHSQPTLLILENEELLKKIPYDSLEMIKRIVLIESTSMEEGQKIIFWQDILKGRHTAIKSNQTLPALNPDDLAFIIYTSSASGAPKEIVYRHSQLISACITIVKTLAPLGEEDITIAWFSLAYMFGRLLNLCAIYCGAQVYFVQDTSTLLAEMRNINPTIFVGVPRFYEKVYAAFEKKINTKPLLQQYFIKMALRVKKNNQASFSTKILDYLILRRIRLNFGSRLKYMLTGSAPISLHILNFFYSIGILILDGYAVTECATPITMNCPNKYKFGTVGLLLDGNEITIAKDGEIMIKSAGLFEGYFGCPAEEKEELFDEAGFLKTGDLGYLDEEGFLVLTGRKKEIIKLSTGLRISPLEIEQVYGIIPYIDHIIVIGNGRKYLIALLTLNKNALIDWHRKNKIFFDDKDKKVLTNSTKVNNLIEESITKRHAELSDFKQIKKFIILSENFSYETGELTSNFKLRRAVIENKYKLEIDRLYAEK